MVRPAAASRPLPTVMRISSIVELEEMLEGVRSVDGFERQLAQQDIGTARGSNGGHAIQSACCWVESGDSQFNRRVLTTRALARTGSAVQDIILLALDTRAPGASLMLPRRGDDLLQVKAAAVIIGSCRVRRHRIDENPSAPFHRFMKLEPLDGIKTDGFCIILLALDTMVRC